MKKLFIFLIFILIIFLTGCSNQNALELSDQLKKVDFNDNHGSIYKDVVLVDEFKNSLINFSYESASKLLNNKNSMYSPVSLYIALSMLAEIADGNTKKEILDTLKVSTVEMLQDENFDLYNKLSFYNQIGRLNIANSVWLKKDENYKDATLKILAEKYYVSSYSVDFKNSSTNKQIGDWVSQNTGGKLGKNDFGNIDPLTVMILLNTIYFYDQWQNEFNENKNEVDKFNNDESLKVEYMNNSNNSYYYKTTSTTSAKLPFKNGGEMVFVLPNDGVDINSIFENSILLKSSIQYTNKDSKEALINYKIPKFEFDSNFDLTDLIKDMGIVDAFSNQADFSKLIDDFLYLSDAIQKSYVKIDEKGCEASVYTRFNFPTSSEPPTEELDFVLDRPFIFAIMANGFPIYIGVVNQPTKI